MAIFLFRKSFVGEGNENDQFYLNFTEEEILNNTHFDLIIEPKSSYLAIVRST